MATLREWLEEEGFDWGNGVIIAHTLSDGSYCAGWGSGKESFMFDFRNNLLPDTQINTLLDFAFDDGFGAPEAPRFIADDGKFLYFPYQYDGSTGLVKVSKSIDYYMDIENETPYPGG